MNYKRLIPVLPLKNGLFVRSQSFSTHQSVSEPVPTLKRLSDWSPDEIILLNISDKKEQDSRRDDKWHSLGKSNFTDLVAAASKFVFAPLSVGGGIRSLDDFKNLFSAGADKCIVNTLLYTNPGLVREAARIYGSQAIVASIDVKCRPDGSHSAFHSFGLVDSNLSLDEAINLAVDLNCGELFIGSVDHDGSAKGYDPYLISYFESSLYNHNLPVIINSGASLTDHFIEGSRLSKISAVAAANVFYFTELSYPKLKSRLISNGEPFRNFSLSTPLNPREYQYPDDIRNNLLAKLYSGTEVDKQRYQTDEYMNVRFCLNCVYPSLSATPTEYASDGICMGCKMSDQKFALSSSDYSSRKKLLLNEIDKIRSKSTSEYDCIIPVSGGKDSYYQTHYVIHELGLNPLLVTYQGNNFSDIGLRNLANMRNVFNCDHLVFSPSVPVLKKLNKLAFVVMGDMNWHNHVGISTTPARVAIQYGIPLIFWGEHGYTDLCGQFTMDDYPEMNFRERTEQDARGFDWNFFLGLDGLSSNDLSPWKYPSDKEIFDLDLRQLFLGHFIPWESNEHLKMMVDIYGFEVSDEPFERTYRKGSNLDDIHENGIHDYLKYIKFGYGRCTDHASKDIRANKLSRKEAITLVNNMDPIKSKDLHRWLGYVDMSESEFDRIADHFRDPRVWSWQNGNWVRNSLTH